MHSHKLKPTIVVLGKERKDGTRHITVSSVTFRRCRLMSYDIQRDVEPINTWSFGVVGFVTGSDRVSLVFTTETGTRVEIKGDNIRLKGRR